MFERITVFILILSIGLLISCGESSTGSDPDPDPPGEPEETGNTTGTLDITTITTGNGTDEDGYTVTLDGNNSTSIDTDDTVTFEDLEEGSYNVELEGLAADCSVMGDNPATANISEGTTTTVEFNVECEEVQSHAEGTIVFMKRVDQSTIQLYLMNADGSNQRQLGSGINGSFPAMSPDGSQVAYTYAQDIWVVDIDGSNESQLTTDGAGNYHVAWSPDGSQILFESERNNNSDIYLMDVDGQNEQQLTVHEANDERPAWSPDGNTIIFNSDRDSNGADELHSIDVSSGEVAVLLEPTDDNGINLRDPSWSPDGLKIAYQGFTNLGHSRVFIADADGGNPEYITSTDVAPLQPAWSPDGNYIAFMSLNDGSNTDAIWTVKVDDQSQIRLTDDVDTYSSFPSWGPTVQ